MTCLGRVLPQQPPAKRWVTLLALLAFFLQGLTVQTHIHQLIQPFAASSQSAPAPLKSQDPIDQCRLCQELVHAGAFVTPPASYVIASPVLTAAVFTASPSTFVSLTTSFAWRSRAPPR